MTARPPAGTTDVTIPALITGRPVVVVSPLNKDRLYLNDSKGIQKQWSADIPGMVAKAFGTGPRCRIRPG